MTIQAVTPTVEIATPYVQHFGNSVVFGNHLDMFPVIFQPFLAYPDWFFMDWPFQMIQCIHDQNHPYFDGYGPIAFGISVLFFIISGIIAINTDDGLTKEAMTLRHHPISQSFIGRVQNGSVLGQLFVLPLVLVNLIFTIVYKVIVIALYWHILFAQIIALILSLKGSVGYELTKVIEKVVLVLILVAPIANIIVKTIALLF